MGIRPHAIVGLLCALTLAGCTANNHGTAGQALPTEYAGYDVSAMIKAHEPDVTSILADDANEFVHEVLDDGFVTDQEMSEARSRLTRCLADAGIDDVIFHADGTMSTSVPEGDEVPEGDQGETECDDDAECRCEVATGFGNVDLVYWMMRLNPLNEDEGELAVECLKKKGIVEPSFTVASFDALFNDVQGTTSITDTSAFASCINDPLQLLPDRASDIEVQ